MITDIMEGKLDYWRKSSIVGYSVEGREDKNANHNNCAVMKKVKTHLVTLVEKSRPLLSALKFHRTLLIGKLFHNSAPIEKEAC